jgi:predicted GTPase
MDKNTTKSELRDLNNQLNINLEKAKNEIINLKKKVEEVKNQKNKDFEDYKKNDYNEEYIDKELANFYDVIINIKSIASLEKDEGWPIKWNESRKDEISKFKDEQLLKIGILGNGNVGKSFLLSRLFKMNIPSGYSVITEGLSLKYNEVDRYTILDSAGLQTPLLSDEKYEDKDEENSKKKYEDLYKDKTQTENFIQNLIIY